MFCHGSGRTLRREREATHPPAPHPEIVPAGEREASNAPDLPQGCRCFTELARFKKLTGVKITVFQGEAVNEPHRCLPDANGFGVGGGVEIFADDGMTVFPHAHEVLRRVRGMSAVIQRRQRAITEARFPRQPQPQIPIIRSPDRRIKAAGTGENLPPDQSLPRRLNPASHREARENIADGCIIARRRLFIATQLELLSVDDAGALIFAQRGDLPR